MKCHSIESFKLFIIFDKTSLKISISSSSKKDGKENKKEDEDKEQKDFENNAEKSEIKPKIKTPSDSNKKSINPISVTDGVQDKSDILNVLKEINNNY